MSGKAWHKCLTAIKISRLIDFDCATDLLTAGVGPTVALHTCLTPPHESGSASVDVSCVIVERDAIDAVTGRPHFRKHSSVVPHTNNRICALLPKSQRSATGKNGLLPITYYYIRLMNFVEFEGYIHETSR